MPVYNTPIKYLDAAIRSCIDQVYKNWELKIADDCSTDAKVRKRLDYWTQRDNRINIVFREENGHISRATQTAFDMVSTEWVALLDHDDVLAQNALAEVVSAIARHPDVEIIYSDEDKIDEEGHRSDPHFKPAYSRELFRSYNYLNHLTVHRSRNIRKIQGWRVGYEGSQDYDLNLRILEKIDVKNIHHIPKILYHWRAIEGFLLRKAGHRGKSYAFHAGENEQFRII